jgi:hypothetical protein
MGYTIQDLKECILLGLAFISFPNRGVLSATPCTLGTDLIQTAFPNSSTIVVSHSYRTNRVENTDSQFMGRCLRLSVVTPKFLL